MNNNTMLPDDFFAELQSWFIGYEFEIIYLWSEGIGHYNVVVYSPDGDDKHVVCVRMFKSIYNELIHVSIDKDFVVPNN